ncbi:hypothetical protein [Microbispora rosea]|uniref:hypothetical protein n=1 Tax=Microbispora rosea TaxID=58117 RepID=UPI0037A5E5E5
MSSRTPLGDYLQIQIDRCDGGSKNAFTGRARDPDTGNTFRVQWVIDLLNGKVNRAPEMWRLRALAAAMASGTDTGLDRALYREHLETLRHLTAAQYLGLEVPAPGESSTASFRVPGGLPAEQRKMVVRWAEMIARDLADDS